MSNSFILQIKKEEQPLGAIPLEGCTSVTKDVSKKENLFKIQTPYRIYCLTADTAEQMDVWVKAIEKYVLSEDVIKMEDKSQSVPSAKISFITNVEKEGYLTKSGSNGRNFKKRWCVLKDNIIYYFRTEKDTSEGAPLGVIPLQDSRVENADTNEKGKKMILIHTRHRTYKLSAETQTMIEWLELIHNCVNRSNGDNKDKRLTKNLSKLKNNFAINYKLEKVTTRKRKIYKSSFLPDDKVDKLFTSIFKTTDYYSPDQELSIWKKSLAA